MLMHSPQLGFPSVARFVALWDLQTESLTSSTNGADLDHSEPVIAFDGQWVMHRTQSPQRLYSMGASALSGASVRTVARDNRGP